MLASIFEIILSVSSSPKVARTTRLEIVLSISGYSSRTSSREISSRRKRLYISSLFSFFSSRYRWRLLKLSHAHLSFSIWAITSNPASSNPSLKSPLDHKTSILRPHYSVKKVMDKDKTIGQLEYAIELIKECIKEIIAQLAKYENPRTPPILNVAATAKRTRIKVVGRSQVRRRGIKE